MNKKIFHIILSMIILALMVSFSSCTNEGSLSIKEELVKIEFVSNGGSNIEAISKKAGEKIEEPQVPVKDGYIFDGWYESIDNGVTLNEKPFVFSYMPAMSITLYAKWVEQVISYTISFISNGGSNIEAISKKAGEKIEEPQVPVKDGYIFDGWYESIDNGVTLNEKPFVFSYMPAMSITLYAKWTLQSVAGKAYKQSDTRFNWKSDAEKALFDANSPTSEDEAIELFKKYKFEFTFVDDEKVIISFFNMETRTYHLYYEIATDNTIKLYENAKEKELGQLYRNVPILNNPFKVSNDRSYVIGIFELGVDFSNGSSMKLELNVICSVIKK